MPLHVFVKEVKRVNKCYEASPQIHYLGEWALICPFSSLKKHIFLNVGLGCERYMYLSESLSEPTIYVWWLRRSLGSNMVYTQNIYTYKTSVCIMMHSYRCGHTPLCASKGELMNTRFICVAVFHECCHIGLTFGYLCEWALKFAFSSLKKHIFLSVRPGMWNTRHFI